MSLFLVTKLRSLPYLEAVEIDGDAKRNGHLVRPGVPLPNRAGAVIDPKRKKPQPHPDGIATFKQ